MLVLAYAVVSYLAFLVSFVYLALFSLGLFVGKTIDSGEPGSVVSALLVDLGLLLLFGLQHSLMARARFKRWLVRFVPASAERSTYVLASSLAVALLVWQWRPLPHVLFGAMRSGAELGVVVVGALGWLGVPAVTFMIDHFELVGLKQAFAAFRRRTLAQTGFVTPLAYKFVRHPMMSSLLVGLWLAPSFTVGHLVFSLGMTAYIVVGVHYEERALVASFGTAYEEYRRTTPRFLPVGARSLEPIARARAETPSSP
jgi:protein-S-isoprenylcysteine O-methyltransferase Ste14